MGDHVRSDRLIGALSDSRFLAALTTLIVNDQILKAAYPSWVTGKLSDFAGMIVFPIMLAALVSALAPTLASAHRVWIWRMSLAVAGATLTAIKTSGAAAGAMEALLHNMTGATQQIIVDPTDLLGLTGLVVAWRVLRSERPARLGKRTRLITLGVAAIACVATSYPDPYASNWNDISIDRDTITVAGDQAYFGWVSTDDGTTWTMDYNLASEDFYGNPPRDSEPITLCPDTAEALCVRLSGHTVQESTDGGDSWETVWSVDPSEPWVKTIGYSDQEDVIITPGDLAVTESGSIIAAFGGIEPLKRTTDGIWSPSVASLRQVPGEMTLASLTVALLCVAVVVVFRKRWLGLGFASGAIGISIGSAGLVALNRRPSSGGGFGALVLVMALIGAVVLYGLVWVIREATRSRPKMPVYLYRWSRTDLIPGALGAVVVWVPFSIWASGRGTWVVANAATVGVGLAAIGFTYLAIQQKPLDPIEIQLPAMPPPPFSSQPPPPSEPAFFSEQTTAVPLPIIYRRPLVTFAVLGVIGLVLSSALAVLPFAFQGVLLNRAGWRLPPWRTRFVLANLVIPATALFSPQLYLFGEVKVSGPQYWFVETLEALLIAAIYLGGRWTSAQANDSVQSLAG